MVRSYESTIQPRPLIATTTLSSLISDLALSKGSLGDLLWRPCTCYNDKKRKHSVHTHTQHPFIIITMNFLGQWSSSIMSRSRSVVNAISLPTLIQQRFMSKYLSKSAAKRLPLSTKRAGKGYYKGKGGTKEGRLTSKGKFIVDPLKRLELIVPDLTGFKVSRSQNHMSVQA